MMTKDVGNLRTLDVAGGGGGGGGGDRAKDGINGGCSETVRRINAEKG